ncbi:hypothetical protein [Intestinibacter bartlettii]|uniref:hypothetical protein n=1 Tax=Intestinibacter bartlettii TaxID=261299 RepID=UPI0039F6338B
MIKLFIIVGIIFIIVRIEQLNNNIQSIPSNKEIIRDSLVRDTLNHTKDSLTIKIVKIRETYEDKKAIIMSNDTSADIQFFTNYINHYNNSGTTENN